jgi:sec-independent protein translocase protein TatA
VGGPELLIALVIILLLFGAKRVPELMKGMGAGVREFRKGTRGDYDNEVEEEKKQKRNSELSSEKTSSGDESRLQEDTSTSADRSEQQKRG